MSDYAENAIDATIAHQPSPGERFYPAFEVTPELDAAASEYVTHYPEGKQKSAVLPILNKKKKKFGFFLLLCHRLGKQKTAFGTERVV